MENKSFLNKKSVGGMVLDILTVGMLFASFAALFYSGFILQSATFPLGAMCAITAVGLLLLFFIGDVTCLVSKSKNHSLTLGFLIFSVVQLVALIVNLTLLLGLMCRLFDVAQLASRITYIVTASLVLIGYVASVSYFSDGVVGLQEEDEDGDDAFEEDADEEDADGEESGEADEDEEALDDEYGEEDLTSEGDGDIEAPEEASYEVDDESDETQAVTYEAEESASDDKETDAE